MVTKTRKKAAGRTGQRPATTGPRRKADATNMTSTRKSTAKMKGAAGASPKPSSVNKPSGGTKPKGGGKKGC